MTTARERTLVVGLDAACWEYLDPLLQLGQMPTLEHLIGNGVSGIMHSTMPPWTPAAWSSIVTGKNPGKHGVFDMLWKRPGSYDFLPTNATFRAGTPFWKRLNESGVRTGLVNVPFTYPIDVLDGFLVCGFGTPNSVTEFAFPAEAQGRIEQQFGPFTPEIETEILRTASPSEILEAEKNHQRRFVRIATDLATRYPVEVLVINLMLPDHANHKMPDMDQVRAAYRVTDEDLSALIDSFRPDNVMLISDHGSSRLKGDFLLGAWLRDQGYYDVSTNSRSESSAALNWLLIQYFQQNRGWSGLREKVARRLVREYVSRFVGWQNGRFWNNLESTFPFAREFVLLSDQPEYSSTQLFPGSVFSGLLYLNVIGRESKGVVPSEQREEIAAEIASKLLMIEEPETGKPLISNVYLAEELFSGPAAINGPDLIIDSYDSGWNMRMGKYSSIPKSRIDRYFVSEANERDFGWHSRDGIFVFSGSAFDHISKLDETNLTDLAATLLHIYGVPIPDDYDGTVLSEMLAPADRMRPVRYQPGDVSELHEKEYLPDEAEALVGHLKALGYLD